MTPSPKLAQPASSEAAASNREVSLDGHLGIASFARACGGRRFAGTPWASSKACPRGSIKWHGRMVRATVWLRFLGIACVGLAVTGATLWGALAIYYSPLPGAPLRLGLAAAFALGTLGAFLFLRNRRRTLLGFARRVRAPCSLWRASIEPSNQRDWQTEVAVLPYATRDGDLVTLHNIRNFDYRTEQDFVAQHDDRTFDLRAAGRGRPDRRLLGGRRDRPRHGELRLRRRARRVLDRDAQGEGRGLLLARRLLQAVRADLRGRRRARPDPGAHQLPAAGGAGLPLPDARARPRPPGACSWSTSGRSTG